MPVQAKIANQIKRARKLTPRMAELVQKEVLYSISEYLDTLYSVLPIWSGRLQRSLFPLSEALYEAGARGNTGSPNGISPTSKAREWFDRHGSDKYGGIDADLSGHTKFRIPNQKGGIKTQFTFSFSSTLPYYSINEVSDAAKAPFHLKGRVPWQSQAKAMSVLKAIANERVPKKVKGALLREMSLILPND